MTSSRQPHPPKHERGNISINLTCKLGIHLHHVIQCRKVSYYHKAKPNHRTLDTNDSDLEAIHPSVAYICQPICKLGIHLQDVIYYAGK